ncbi:MAG: FecR family protein [Pseudobacter sp.]|uniref:FecR family protein n=1 Tax=Pseudobacter sp. TaxID=2045420 RepID=UPI003F80AD18
MSDSGDINIISQLLFRSMTGQLDAAERKQLNEWRNASSENNSIYEEFQRAELWQKEVRTLLDNRRKVDQALLNANVPVNHIDRPEPGEGHIVPFRRKWIRYAAAAVLLIGVGAYFYRSNPSVVQSAAVANNNEPAASFDKATLTLSDGSVVQLDSAGIGMVAKEGESRIVKLEDGQVKYEPGSGMNNHLMNEMATPTGGQYKLTLPDGSRVWLNASSSIKYPVAFTNEERVVSVKGEVFFEVAKDVKKPFRVKVGDMQIDVLGTSFNVNAYDNEPLVKTTLLDGSVKVSNKKRAVHLSPEEQSQMDLNGQFVVKNSINTEETIAWKNGYFYFDKVELPIILREFARWYDLDVVYEGAIPDEKLLIILKRSSSLQSVLGALQINNIDFAIDGRKLIIRSAR